MLFRSLSAYCTESLKALEELGVTDGRRRLLTQAERNALENQEEGPWTEGAMDAEVVAYEAATVYTEGRSVRVS